MYRNFIDTDEDVDAFLKRRWEYKKQQRHVGSDIHFLSKLVRKHQGTIMDAFRDAPKQRNWRSDLYACYIPHLMVYPTRGGVNVNDVQKLVVGNDERTPVTVSE